ncbi:hypothetical protein [Spirosoma montaniterrae]|uniref:Uncharacterized protein n=1 Tax=Spirosoma montaniterrae TaxID=1178516 RepID=A0A1P9WZ01_9BACT|nr:hypothetical protein [Spirosoma montaniterrae]AQG80548.1 hypothetical protein AWR27_15180 [Spirosoma montaniterrae]
MKRKRVDLGRLALGKETLAHMDGVQGGAWPQTSGMGGYSPTCGISCGCTSGCTHMNHCETIVTVYKSWVIPCF